ncbi:flavin reductase family protein [Roseovarius pelagicus]|uniref:Flavin reductase family protein n=1 Tax=Roseovarius pelagicus TaxID=2980108 RepID=A0ABY6D7D5_9RHOB|nr:flavin reductase family protein [Roseovarius pelagicus]UXX81525.1 flavin reductase family protein [Roseovarius pelagicus]
MIAHPENESRMSTVQKLSNEMLEDIQTTTLEDFVAAMRQVANSVVVVTTDGIAGRYGGTVNGFNSVAAAPPSVLICLPAECRLARKVEANGCFTINVLPEELHFHARIFSGEFDDTLPDRFSNIDFIDVPKMAPRFPGATFFASAISSVTSHGDHKIFVGEVCAVGTERRYPLAYHDGGYRYLNVIHEPV